MSDQNLLIGKGPLMYIVQPNLDIGTGRMQKSFITKKNKNVVQIDHDGKMSYEQAAEADKVAEKVSEKSRIKNNKQEATVAQVELTEEKSQAIVTGVRKPFKDMTVDEKINYLINRPVYIPKIPCEVKTSDETFVGYVESYKNGVLTLVSNSDLNGFRANSNEIVSIRLLGI
ncbi:MAG: hypothetical protein K0S51_901 [Bacillales bacterium]|jgi:hypothetical protein|nr:hypothetical protein [Bacillales bacterium]